MESMIVSLAPERERTRVLVSTGGHDVLKAVLGPPRLAHRRAAATLLEGLALWHQTRLCVVLSAGGQAGSCDALGLCDALGFGEPNLHYDVQVAGDVPRRRQLRLPGMGSFGDLRRLQEGVRL